MLVRWTESIELTTVWWPIKYNNLKLIASEWMFLKQPERQNYSTNLILHMKETIIQCWSLWGMPNEICFLLSIWEGLNVPTGLMAALVSIPPHTLTSPVCILNMLVFYSCLFPILNICIKESRLHIEKAGHNIWEMSSLNLQSRKVCLHLQYIQTFRTPGALHAFSIICI